MLIVQFTNKSVEVYKTYERVSIDYPIFIIDFDLPTQKTFGMDTKKRQVEIVKVDNTIIWSIYDQPFEIDDDGTMIKGKKPKVKKHWLTKLREDKR